MPPSCSSIQLDWRTSWHDSGGGVAGTTEHTFDHNQQQFWVWHQLETFNTRQISYFYGAFCRKILSCQHHLCLDRGSQTSGDQADNSTVHTREKYYKAAPMSPNTVTFEATGNSQWGHERGKTTGQQDSINYGGGWCPWDRQPGRLMERWRDINNSCLNKPKTDIISKMMAKDEGGLLRYLIDETSWWDQIIFQMTAAQTDERAHVSRVWETNIRSVMQYNSWVNFHESFSRYVCNTPLTSHRHHCFSHSEDNASTHVWTKMPYLTNCTSEIEYTLGSSFLLTNQPSGKKNIIWLTQGRRQAQRETQRVAAGPSWQDNC